MILTKPRTADIMTHEDIVAKFADALKQFELIDGQLLDTILT